MRAFTSTHTLLIKISFHYLRKQHKHILEKCGGSGKQIKEKKERGGKVRSKEDKSKQTIKNREVSKLTGYLQD